METTSPNMGILLRTWECLARSGSVQKQASRVRPRAWNVCCGQPSGGSLEARSRFGKVKPTASKILRRVLASISPALAALVTCKTSQKQSHSLGGCPGLTSGVAISSPLMEPRTKRAFSILLYSWIPQAGHGPSRLRSLPVSLLCTPLAGFPDQSPSQCSSTGSL